MKTICEKKPYCNNRIDECIREEVAEINSKVKFRTIMSCCGYDKYSKTIIVQNIHSGAVFEWFSGIGLTGSKRSDSRAPYYKKDPEGYYFIPELVNDGCPMCGSREYHDYLEGFKCSSCGEHFKRMKVKKYLLAVVTSKGKDLEKPRCD